MKKFFTLFCALVAGVSAVNASTVDDIAVCKHSYVLVMDEVTGTTADNKGAKPGKGVLFGDNFFLDVTGGSVANNKQMIDLAEQDSTGAYVWFEGKYAEYGNHYNSFRLKNAQDVIAMKVTAQSKVIVLGQKHSSRYAIFNTQADMKGTTYGDGEANSMQATFTAPDDMTIYIGSQGGDYYISYVIVEAKEAPGTPTVKVGAQTYENGLWFREVTCKCNTCLEDGADEPSATICTYTTDGSTPDATSPVYTAPIKCYADQTVKFQAFLDNETHTADPDFICAGADNEGIASFQFDAPTITAEGANVTITSPYEGAKNYYSYGEVTDQEGSTITLTESATITAYSQIVNGSYTTFTTKTTTKDVYVLNAIKSAKTINVSGTAVVDEEATATSTTGTVYAIENGALTADKMDFFVKNLVYGAIANADTANVKYQVPAGQEAYIKMSDTNITFLVAETDSLSIKVTCSKNSCKTLNPTDDESVTTDRKIYVNVDGTTYGFDDITNGNVADLEGYQNVIEFKVGPGTHTFQKYSGTGNILISSIEFTPCQGAGIQDVEAEQTLKTVKVFENGQFVIKTANGNFNAAGVRVK